MAPLTLGELFTLCGLLLNGLSVLYVIRRFSGDKAANDAASIAEKTERRIYQEQQSKQLDEIYKTVQKISSKIDDHSLAIERLNERQSTLFRRMEWIEGILGKHAKDDLKVGSTD